MVAGRRKLKTDWEELGNLMAEVAQSARRNQVNAFAASFMGWTLDAYGFFVVVFLVGTLSTAFHVGKALIIVTLTAMLAARPVGAFVFGLLTDRYGRRAVLMLNVSYFILMELLLGFSSSYKFFLIAGVIYGMGFGGMWGVGASLSMEAVPQRWRGLLSGVLQSGYSVGYIIAAIAARFVLPTLGWRWMFWMGGILGLVTLLVSFGAPESEAWKQHRAPSMVAVLRIVGQEWKQFAYLVFMMVFMMFLSHGTQDLYPDFLRSTHGASNSAVAYIAILFNIGAIVGAILFGALSQRLGRRFAMVGALVLSIAVIPWWAFGGTLATLTVGAFLMQVGVQGAWGVIPAHLTEMSNDSTRGLVPGLAYQLGILFAAPTPTIEYLLRDRIGYHWALAGFEIITIVVLAVTLLLGKERRGRSFVNAPTGSSS